MAFLSSSSLLLSPTLDAVGEAPGREAAVRAAEGLAASVAEQLGISVAVVDGSSGELLWAPDILRRGDWAVRGELCRAVARRRRPETIEDHDPLYLTAIPLGPLGDSLHVAVAAVVSRDATSDEDVLRLAEQLEVDEATARWWAESQRSWPRELFEQMGAQIARNAGLERRVEQLERDVETLSDQLLSTYEEITLLYRLTHNLQISGAIDDLCRMTLDWLTDVVPAAGLAIRLLPPDESQQTAESLKEPLLITHGDCPCDDETLARLVEHLRLAPSRSSKVANRAVTSPPDWPFPEIRELVVVPLLEGDNLFGWLAAFNHSSGGEFGTVEANLLTSIGSILGMHGSNIELYRQQADLVMGIVRALTSAIDAKDPYTCGHSDRVARISVRLAEELGCDTVQIKTLYLGGLLHDVGKIGIDDHILRKPGKLTDAEYEHIKTHSNIGYNILVDLKKIAPVLPIVRHHHEAWDGRGYPHQLKGEEIPFLARIAAVADAFDAMASDRPYRRGLDDEKVDEIFRRGAGGQWDAKVVEAFFQAREDVGAIVRGTDEPSVPVSQWT